MKKLVILILFSPYLFLNFLYSDTVFLYKGQPYTVEDLVGVDVSYINEVLNRGKSSRLVDMRAMYLPPALSPYVGDWSDLSSLLKHELSGVVQTFVHNRAIELLLDDHPFLKDILDEHSVYDMINREISNYAYRNTSLAYALKKSENRSEFERILNIERGKYNLHSEVISDKRYAYTMGFKNNIVFINDLFPCIVSGEYSPWLVEYFHRFLSHYVIKKSYEIDYNSIRDLHVKYRSKYKILDFSIKENKKHDYIIHLLEGFYKENEGDVSERGIINFIKNNKTILDDLELIGITDFPGVFLERLYENSERDNLFEMGRVFRNQEKDGHYFFVFDIIESPPSVDIEFFHPGYFVYSDTKKMFFQPYVERVLEKLEMKWDIVVPSAEVIAGSNAYPVELKL
jgi:hypothetical protein